MSPAVLILDTNVVLDLFFFQDRRCAALATGLEDRRWRWIATPAMRDEIEHVMARGLPGRWPGSAATVKAGWDRWATSIDAVDRPLPPRLRCTDPDDQKFVDLALQVGADVVLSADRALLRLARAAREHGFEIATVGGWTSRLA